MTEGLPPATKTGGHQNAGSETHAQPEEKTRVPINPVRRRSPDRAAVLTEGLPPATKTGGHQSAGSATHAQPEEKTRVPINPVRRRSPDRAAVLTEGLPQPILISLERYQIHAEAGLYFCTFSVTDWLPVFVTEKSCQIITDSLAYCQQHKQLGLDAFVIMPTHLHLIGFDREWNSTRLEQTLVDFRKFTGRVLAQFCAESMPLCFAAALAAAAGDDRDHRFWQPTRHPESIATEKFHNQKRDYLHDNPRRKGLVRHPADWRWSSAKYYETGQDCAVPVTPVGW